jgi:hypothetical protein
VDIGNVLQGKKYKKKKTCLNYKILSTFCGAPKDYNLPYDQKERDIPTLNFGFNNFDTIYWSLFTGFQLLRTTGWSSIVFIVNIFLLSYLKQLKCLFSIGDI